MRQSLGTCQIRPGGFFIDRDSVKVLGGAMEVALKVEVDQAAGYDQKSGSGNQIHLHM